MIIKYQQKVLEKSDINYYGIYGKHYKSEKIIEYPLVRMKLFIFIRG